MSNQSPSQADGIGVPRRRVEDLRLLTGRGCYASDRFPSRLCHAALVRSPHAHARIRSIDTKWMSVSIAVMTATACSDGIRESSEAKCRCSCARTSASRSDTRSATRGMLSTAARATRMLAPACSWTACKSRP